MSGSIRVDNLCYQYPDGTPALRNVSFQVEQLEPEVYLNCHEELLVDSTRSRMSHCFSPTSRLSASPLSVIQTEERPHSLLVHTFHTFPDEHTIVKTQSLIERK